MRNVILRINTKKFSKDSVLHSLAPTLLLLCLVPRVHCFRICQASVTRMEVILQARKHLASTKEMCGHSSNMCFPLFVEFHSYKTFQKQNIGGSLYWILQNSLQCNKFTMKMDAPSCNETSRGDSPSHMNTEMYPAHRNSV